MVMSDFLLGTFSIVGYILACALPNKHPKVRTSAFRTAHKGRAAETLIDLPNFA